MEPEEQERVMRLIAKQTKAAIDRLGKLENMLSALEETRFAAAQKPGGPAPDASAASALEELAGAQSPQGPSPAAGFSNAASRPPRRSGIRCYTCGYVGHMPRKYPTWVIVCAILFFPMGLLFLAVGKKWKCPQCGTMSG